MQISQQKKSIFVLEYEDMHERLMKHYLNID